MKQAVIKFQGTDTPTRDLERFTLANQGKYKYKPEFYQFKSEFLKQYGHSDGYDLQEIVKECYSCEGSGIHWSGNMCWNCTKGVYMRKKILLARYILNDRLFHLPTTLPWEYAIIRNKIDGLIVHICPDHIAASKAFYFLCLKYDKGMLSKLFLIELRETGRSIIHTTEKHLQPLRNIFLLCKRSKVKFETEDLPF